jgi:hypothetical protein
VEVIISCIVHTVLIPLPKKSWNTLVTSLERFSSNFTLAPVPVARSPRGG